MVRSKRKALNYLFSFLLCVSHLNTAVIAEEEEILPVDEEEQEVLAEELPEEEEQELTVPEETETEEPEILQEEEPGETPEETEVLPEEGQEELLAEASEPEEEKPAEEENPEEEEPSEEENTEEDKPAEKAAEEESEVTGPFFFDASQYLFQEGAVLKEEEEKSETYATGDTYDPHTDFASLNAVFQSVVSGWGTMVNVLDYHIPSNQDDASQVYASLTNANPQFFYLSRGGSYYISGDYVSSYELSYDTGYTQADSETFETRVNEIVAGVDSSWNDTQKALYLHDVLVIENTYDQSLQKRNAYNALIDKTSVCQGYALAYKYLLSKVGIESDIISCESFNHAWNSVVIDGTTYYVDTTWDDPTGTYRMRCRHANFLRNKDGLLGTGHYVKNSDGSMQSDEKDWVNSFGENIYNSYLNEYPNAYWLNCETQIPHIGNTWFYADSNDGDIWRYNASSGSSSLLTTLDGRWGVVDKEGYSYTDKYISLDVFKDKVVASQQDQVYLIDMSGNLTSVGTLTSAQSSAARIYGIQTEGYDVRYDLYTSPGTNSLYSSGYFVLEEYIPVTGITLNRTSYSFSSIGSTYTLSATVSPSDATDPSVTWTSSNTGVATVTSSGKVTAVGSGTAKIRAAATSDPSIYKECTVTVTIAAQSVSVSPTQQTLRPGDSLQLTATVLPPETTNKTVTWTSNNTSVATVSSSGLVSAASPGSATITATTSNAKTATCQITVESPVTGVTLSENSLALNAGGSAQLTATVLPTNAANKNVVWTSADPAVATVSADGLVSAVGNGQTVITVTTEDGGYTDTCTVTVTTPLKGITLSDHSVTIQRRNTKTLSVTFDPEDASDKTVTWTSNNTSVATVNSSGKVTAVGGGSAVITATANDGGYTDSCTVTVTVPLNGIHPDVHDLQMGVGETYTVSVRFDPEDTTEDKSLRWTSGNKSIATVTSAGVITAVSPGHTTITITQISGSHRQAQISVYVTTQATGLVLTEHELTLNKGWAISLGAGFTPTGAEYQTVVWSSSDETVATVEQDGTVSAVGKGTAIITASTEDGSLSDSCTVTVRVPVEEISISGLGTELKVGETMQLGLSVMPEDAETEGLVWSSSDPYIATIDQTGKVTGVSEGEVRIGVTSEMDNLYVEVTLRIIPDVTPVTGVTLSENTLTLVTGESTRLTAYITPEDATNQKVDWTSADTSVVTVDEEGYIKAVGSGQTTVTVMTEDGGYTDTCIVTVISALNGISLNKNSLTLEKGSSVLLTVTFDPEDASEALVWTSSNTSIVSVDQNGNVTGLKGGEATVTVSTEDGLFSDRCTMTVKVPMQSVSMDKGQVFVYLGETYQQTVTFYPADTTDDKTLTWGTFNSDLVSVDQNGKIKGLSTGIATVYARTAGGLLAQCSVYVVVPMEGIVLSAHALTMAPDERKKLNYSYVPEDAMPHLVSWSSSDESVATVDEDGYVTAVGDGTAVITITTKTDNFSDTCTVTVSSETPVTGVSLSKHSMTMNAGESTQLTASVLPSDASNKTVYWTSADTAIATVDSQGTVRAVGGGQTTITVTTADGGFTDTCTVNVSVPLESITMDHPDVWVYVGETYQQTVTFTPENTTDNKKLTWACLDTSLASVDQNGKIKGLRKGMTTVIATTDNGLIAQCNVFVVVRATGIVLNAHDLTLNKGTERTLSYEFTPDGAKPQNVTWSSSDENVVTVNADGRLNAVGKGTADITVTSQDGTLSDTCKVTVRVPVEEVRMYGQESEVRAGESIQFTADVQPEDAEVSDLVWSSSDPEIATVDQSGLVTGVSEGEVTISVTSEADGISTSVTVYVMPGTITKITLSEEYIELIAPPEIFDLDVYAGDRQLSDYEVIWSTSDEWAASVDEQGVVTAVWGDTGTVYITATLASDETVSATCEVIVRETVSVVREMDNARVLYPGEEYDLTARFVPEYGEADWIGWESSSPYTASVDEYGHVTALRSGTAVISVYLKHDGRMYRRQCDIYVVGDDYRPVSQIDINLMNYTDVAWTGSMDWYTAYVYPDSATVKKVNWKSSDYSVADVDPDGYVYFRDPGVAYVWCEGADGNRYQERRIVSLPEGSVFVKGFAFDKHELTVPVGYSKQLPYHFTPSDATNQNLEWTVEDESIVEVSPDGRITGLRTGTTYVYARTEAGDYTDTCEVTVTNDIPVESITLDQTSVTLGDYLEKYNFTIHVSPEDATDLDFVYTSDNENVVTVSEDGTVTAVGNGTATVKVAWAADENVYALCQFSVVFPVMEPALSDIELSLEPGETKQLSVDPGDPRYEVESIDWTSDDKYVAAVDDNGLVTAMYGGETTIRCHALINGTEYELTCTVFVSGDPYIPVEEVVLSAPQLILLIGDSYHITSSVKPYNATNRKLTWTSDDESVATVDENGLVTGVGTGKTVVRASTEDGVYAECPVTSGWWIEHITLAETDITLTRGDTYQIVWTVEPEEASGQKVVFDNNRPDVLTVDENGLITATGVGPAIIIVSPESSERPGRAYLNVYVKEKEPDPVPVISDSEVILNAWGKRQLSVRSWDDEHVIDFVSWTSDDTKVAEVDEDGLLTAIAGGTTTIHGYVYIGGEEYEVTCAVTVNGDPYTPVEEVVLSASRLAMLIGDTYHLNAHYLPENASRWKVFWSSDDESVAKVDENGNVTAVGTGTTVIRATSEDGVYAECSVKSGWWIEQITLAETNLTLEEGDTYQLSWTALPEEAADQKVVFTTDRPDVVSIDENGLVTAIGLGPAIIRVEPADSERQTYANCSVYVREKTPVHIPVTSLTLNVGDSYAFEEVGSSTAFVVSYYPQDADDKTVTWSSSDESVATVNEYGEVMAMGAGEAVITAVCPDGVSVSCSVTVSEEEAGRHVFGDYIYFTEGGTAKLVGIINKPADVVIPSYVGAEGEYTVTAIDAGVFKGHAEIETLVIPDTVTEIGAYAFEDCISLREVTMSGSLYEFAPGVFMNCSALSEITLPSSICHENNIDEFSYDGPFADCYNLKTVNFVQGTTGSSFWMIPDGLFKDCYGLEEMNLPQSVHKIGTYAFEGCANLKSITLPEYMESIGRGAFENCYRLEGVYGLQDLYEAGPYAFRKCESLTEVGFVSSLSSLPDGLFESCVSLRSVSLSADLFAENDHVYQVSPFEGCENLREVVFAEYAPEEYGVLPAELFRNCTGIEEITLPSYTFVIGMRAFEGCENLRKVVIPDSVGKIREYAFKDCVRLEDVTLSKTLYLLENGVFENCVSLESIVLPKSLSELHPEYIPSPGAFAGCSNLRKVTFEEGFTVIPEGLFKDCTGLTGIEIPETVYEIGKSAFENTSLTDIWVGFQVSMIDDSAFHLVNTGETGLRVHYSGTESLWNQISIGADNEALENAVFDYITPVTFIGFAPGEFSLILGEELNLEPIIEPDRYAAIPLEWTSSDDNVVMVDENGRLVTIGEGEAIITASLGSVFGTVKVTVTDLSVYEYTVSGEGVVITKYTGSDENVVVPAMINGLPVREIGESAFALNETVKSVKLPETVRYIGPEAFMGCSALTEFVIPEGVMKIENGTFLGCERMESIIIPDTVTEIGHQAFYKCYALDHVYLPDSVTVLGDQVFFRNTGLTEIRLSSSLTEIPLQSFYYCTSLADITIPDSVVTIGEQAFEGCALLEHVVLPSSLETVEEDAFKDIAEEVTVRYNGSQYHFDQIEFLGGNELVEEAERVCVPAEEDRVPAEAPVIWYRNEKGALKKAGSETTVREGTVISLTSAGEGEVRYTLDGSDPVTNGTVYTSEISLQFAQGDALTVKAVVVPGEESEYRTGPVTEATFLRKENTWQEDPGDVTVTDAETVDEVIPEGIWVTGIDEEFTYTGKARTFSSLRVYDGNKLLKKNTDYTVKYFDNIHVHTNDGPVLKITGKGNYKDVITIPFEIRQADLSEASASDLSVKYLTALNAPSPAVTCNGLKLKEGTDFIVENRPEEIDPETGGAFELTLTGINDFRGSLHVMMYVTPDAVKTVAVSKVTAPKIASVPYVKGEHVDPASLTTATGLPLTFKYSRKVLNEDQYTLSVTNDEKPGTAYLVMTGTGVPDENGIAFTGTRKISFRLTGPSVKISLYPETKEFTYDGKEKKLVMRETGTDEVLKEGEDYKVTWSKKPVNAGTYTATVTGITYTGSMKLTVKVLPVTEGISFTADTKYVKGGKPAVTVRCNGLLLKSGTDYTVTYGKLTGLTQSVTVKMKGNYKGTLSETVTMDPKDLSEVTIKVKDSAYASRAGKNYVLPSLTDTNGKALKAGTDYVKPVAGSDAYTYVKDTKVTIGTGKNAVQEYRMAGEPVRKTDIIPTGTMIKVTVQAKGNYTGSISAVYMVISAVNRLTGAKVTVRNSYEYTGKAVIPSLQDIEVVLKDGTVLSPEDFEIISVTNNIKPSRKAKVTVRGVNGRGYGGTAAGLFTIERQVIDLTDTSLEENNH